MTKRRVLICGATGFIGRNMAEALAADPAFAVRATYRTRAPFACPGLEWVRADLTDPAEVAAATENVDVLIQAAATTSGAKDILGRPHIHVTDNAVMNALLLRAAFEKRIGHSVFFSCSIMYASRETPQAEDDFDSGQALHPAYFGAGWTKLYLEKMCEFYARQGAGKFTAIRHSNVYGPHDKFDLERSHVFGATVTKVLNATGGRLVVWGDGEAARDLLYVGDLVEFVRLVLDRQPGPFGLYNVGLGRAVTVRELAAKIAAAAGRDLKIEFDRSKPSIDTRISLDCAKAEREIGWRPRVSLEDGIARTLAWRRANPG